MNSIFSETYTLTAGESNARGEMPATLMVERMIEIATRHANALGIGFDRLNPMGVAWVLSRLAYTLDRVPAINDVYTISTWIESWSRVYSNRCFRVADAAGNTIGTGRTIWAAIDIERRTAADLTDIAAEAPAAEAPPCVPPPMRAPGRVADADVTRTADYTFRFMDLDFNRHVNSVRYIEHVLNLWPLEHYDRHRVRTLEAAYRHECLYGQTVRMAVADEGPRGARIDLTRDGAGVVAVRIEWGD